MKKIISILLVVLSINCLAEDKTGLLIIAHGSPSKQWNQPVLNMEDSVKSLLQARQVTGFDEVRVALMEFTEPSVATVVKEMENKGITKIYALPLFIAPSGHSVYDIPSILGLYYNKKTGDALKEEKTEIVDSKAKITVGPTLNYGTVIQEILLERVKELSEDPHNEALVILAHGSENFYSCWQNIANKAGNFILAKTGIEYFKNAFVEVGQSFAVNGINAILDASSQKNKVIVVGMYLASGVEKMPQRSGIMMMGRSVESKEMLKGKNIVYSNKGLLPNAKITGWIVDRAVEWLKQ
ncbi:MAG: CbiX/SirB N-terminal domain-containing protein [Proteiniphilum sp.]|nr:CbiX/SirB N-terminal domain-containing protein [Proteiniphilum sp.]MDD3908393.1 CbiX/SirB N-terminal domain-containing protein [Proteiniphilum sp.]MDD4415768.1 CbiX/SirB N-terminal domain-containing protein [Proteiniphilum sp.]